MEWRKNRSDIRMIMNLSEPGLSSLTRSVDLAEVVHVVCLLGDTDEGGALR